MESIVAVVQEASGTSGRSGVPEAGSVLDAFAQVPDPRRAQGRRVPLPAVLALAVPAILANHLSILAIAEWGAAQPAAWLAGLGFRTGKTPHQTTLQRLFRKRDSLALRAALTAVVAPPIAPPSRGAHRGWPSTARRNAAGRPAPMRPPRRSRR